MTRALVLHPGTQHAVQMATEFHRLRILGAFHSGFVVGQGSTWQKIADHIPDRLRRSISNRMADEVPAILIHNHLVSELAWQLCQANGLTQQSIIYRRNAYFQQHISTRELAEADVVIGFDTSSWLISRRCRAIGKPMIMVHTTCHPVAAEATKAKLVRDFPAWGAIQEEPIAKLRQAQEIEFEYSSAIVCASNFSRQTLVENGVPADKISVISHGVDAASFSPERSPSYGDRPFRFIFVGSISALKGVPILLDAWRRLAAKNVELWLVGPISHGVSKLIPSLPGLRLLGQVPHKDVPNVFRQCDVFVFPSYFEGFGLVILEAMACGLPVITTLSTAGPDLISTPGGGGWIVPTGDVEPLASAMAHCLEKRDEMPAVGKIARQIAEAQNWQRYGMAWLPFIEQVKQQAS